MMGARGERDIGHLGGTGNDVLCSGVLNVVADASDRIVHAGIRKELGNLRRSS
jgi:hypothetical protein